MDSAGEKVADAYACECSAGWTGGRCDTNIDECASAPCVNGACTDRFDAYRCDCRPAPRPRATRHHNAAPEPAHPGWKAAAG